MTRLQELIAQKITLENQIEELRKSELADAVGKIKAMIAEFGLSQEDIFGGLRAKQEKVASGKPKVAAKYRDPVSGKEWSGRGLSPKWLQGKDKTDFLIQA